MKRARRARAERRERELENARIGLLDADEAAVDEQIDVTADAELGEEKLWLIV